jgi:hypothetical protein
VELRGVYNQTSGFEATITRTWDGNNILPILIQRVCGRDIMGYIQPTIWDDASVWKQYPQSMAILRGKIWPFFRQTQLSMFIVIGALIICHCCQLIIVLIIISITFKLAATVFMFTNIACLNIAIKKLISPWNLGYNKRKCLGWDQTILRTIKNVEFIRAMNMAEQIPLVSAGFLCNPQSRYWIVVVSESPRKPVYHKYWSKLHGCTTNERCRGVVRFNTDYMVPFWHRKNNLLLWIWIGSNSYAEIMGLDLTSKNEDMANRT